MSRLQSKTKPALLPLLLNESASIELPQQQETLATWAAMFTMVYALVISKPRPNPGIRQFLTTVHKAEPPLTTLVRYAVSGEQQYDREARWEGSCAFRP